MRLKKLYIHGFKSFADRVEMTFEHGVTGIVGPNGCGKSNISDAVRWVLGEQSARQLRGTKMEDVIFNGTEKRRRMAFCEVTLTFDNEDHSLPVDYSEVSVTRRVFRTGESEYLLNGTACRLKDIIDLFRDTGIGRDGYSLIGQGRIDEILSQKSEDRRQVFEEAAGIVKYKTRKQEAEKRLENTKQNLDRVTDILDELESRIEPLRVQSEDARKYLALREEQKGLDLNVFLVRTQRYQERIEELRQTTEELRQTLSENESEQAELGARRASRQNELAQSEKETADLRESLQTLIQEVEAQEGAANVLRERMAADQRERDRLEGEFRAAQEGSGGIEKRINELSEEIERESASLSGKEEALKALDAELSEQEKATAACEEQSEEAKERVIRFMNDLGDVKSEQARLTALREAIDRQIASLSAGSAEDDEQTGAYRRAVEDAEDVLSAEKERFQALENAVREVSEKTRGSGEEFDRLSAETQKLQSARQELGSRLKLLTEMQRDYEGYNLSVKQVLKEAERRGGAGVHGVVASVLHAPQRLERALDMVLGGALQNIVVDRDEDAQEMIEYLKRNRYGRATFLPISSVRGRTLDAAERRVLSMPGCVGLASEMVEFEPVYRGIVDSLLGRTVIAEDLTTGIAIQRAGRYQFRLVTLDGDVMHSGGSMTGGSTQSRMTSLLSREREITESTENMRLLNEKYERAQQKMRDSEETRAALKKERAQLFDELHQQEIAVTRAEEHLSRANEELRSHSARAGRVVAARAQLEEQKTEIENELSELGKRKQNEEGAGDELRAEAKRLQTQLSEMRTKLDETREKASDARVKLATAARGLEAQRQDLERLNRQKGDTARIMRESGEALKALGERMDGDESALKDEENRLALMKSSLENARAEFQKADGARLRIQAELQEISENAERLRVLTEELSDRNHRAEMLLSRVEGELEQMTARIWEDYQVTYEGAEPFRDPEFKLSESEKRLNVLRAEIRAMGSVNLSAMDEYRETSQRFAELSAQKEDLTHAQDDLLGIISELTGKMEKMFKSQFEQLDVYFRQTFSELFGGGRAELRMEDPKDPLGCGIEIVAQPPGKKLQMLSLLSGGERALTAIAILFAMLKLKPTPFCILDEIEAALDDANIDNFADYLKTYSVKTQFVVVTHRKGTMYRCDALYGVAMEEKGVSKMMSVKLADAI